MSRDPLARAHRSTLHPPEVPEKSISLPEPPSRGTRSSLRTRSLRAPPALALGVSASSGSGKSGPVAPFFQPGCGCRSPQPRTSGQLPRPALRRSRRVRSLSLLAMGSRRLRPRDLTLAIPSPNQDLPKLPWGTAHLHKSCSFSPSRLKQPPAGWGFGGGAPGEGGATSEGGAQQTGTWKGGTT